MSAKYGRDYAGRLFLPYRKVRGWRIWWIGVREAIEQRGIIGYGLTFDEGDDWYERQEDYDRGLCVGEWIARRVWG